MRGAITGKDVFIHAHTIVRLFGVSAFLACAWAAVARRRSTFLGVLSPALLGASGAARRDPAAQSRWGGSP